METEDKLVLVVEDETDLRTSILASLNSERYRSVGVANAREAIFKLKNQKFSLVLLDLKLEEGNGEEVLQFMRTRPDHKNQSVPVLITSGTLDKEVVARISGLVQGALVKPFNLASLIAQVKRLIGPAPTEAK